MSIGETLGIWVAALLTLVMFSFIYRDNPLYKIGEHLFLGVSLGYSWCLYYYSNIYPQAIAPLMPGPAGAPPKDWGLLAMTTIVPVVLGLFILLRVIPQLAWLSRYSFAIYIGGAAGLSVPVEMSGRLLPLISGMMVPLKGSPGTVLTNLIMLVGVTATVIYFFFSLEHKGALGRFSRLGVLFVMVSFGASFGNTVMARVSLLIGRFQFLIYKWFQGVILGHGS
jgi:hypothetical protein